jgi:hypothetical protein
MAQNVFLSAELFNLVLRLVQLFIIHRKTLHHYTCFVVCRLTKFPRNNSEIDASIFKQIKNSVKNVAIKQMASKFKRKALHTDAALRIQIL